MVLDGYIGLIVHLYPRPSLALALITPQVPFLDPTHLGFPPIGGPAKFHQSEGVGNGDFRLGKCRHTSRCQ